MSNEQQNTLSRRPSIHSSSARNRLSRQFSTLEIEVEYISTNQQTQSLTTESPAQSRNSLHARDFSHPDLSRVIEEEEEEEERGNNTTPLKADNDMETGAGVGVGSYSPNARLPSRQYPATMPRPRTFRPSSQLYFQQQQQHQTWLPHHFSDQSARHESTDRRSTLSSHSSRYGTSGSGHVGGHSVHTSVSHSEYIQSSQILHDETPALSSSGSQTDEDDDEVQSPVECLDVLDDDGEDDVEGEEGRAPAGRQSEGESGHKPIPSRIDHRPLEFETETPEILKRERTRILERTVVNSYRQIDFADISNIKRLKRGGYGEIHTAEWSRLSVVLKRSLPGNDKGAEEFEHEVNCHIHNFLVLSASRLWCTFSPSCTPPLSFHLSITISPPHARTHTIAITTTTTTNGHTSLSIGWYSLGSEHGRMVRLLIDKGQRRNNLHNNCRPSSDFLLCWLTASCISI